VYATWSKGKKKIFSRKEVSKEVSKEGIAHFDNKPTFPTVALFLDASNALILKEGPGGAYIRVGMATFFRQPEEADEVNMPDGTVRQITIV
jgi:hypothetical protein